MNGCQKGKRGEREAARELLRVGFCIEARRGRQYSGLEGEDVVHSVNGVHIEVKRTETLSLYPALEQAARDAGERIPILMHKRNRKDWVFILRTEDLIPLLARAGFLGAS